MIPGLPDRKVYGNLSLLKPDSLYTLIRQLHNADRAGLHTDVRIGNPALGLLSFAAPKDLPLSDQDKRLLIRQPLHTWLYKDFGRLNEKNAKNKLTQKDFDNLPVLDYIRTVLRNTSGYGYYDAENNKFIDGDIISDKEFASGYKLQTPLNLLKYKAGVCWDGTNFIDQILTKNGILHKNYFLYGGEDQNSTHTTTLFKLNGMWHWMDPTWGLHTFGSRDSKNWDWVDSDPVNLIKRIRQLHLNTFGLKLDIYLIPAYPKAGATVNQFMNYMLNNAQLIVKAGLDSGVIDKGYGKGTVKKLLLSPIAILLNTGNKIKFTRADKRNAPVYTMIQTKNGNWITTIKTLDNPPEIQLYDKLHFKEISLLQAANLMDSGATATAKLDGAGARALIGKHGIDVYGVNKDKYGKLIKYTDHIGGLRNLNIPKELVGKDFRALVIGLQNGRALLPQLIAGLLNNTLLHNIQNRKNRKISLGLAALAIGDDYSKDAVHKLVQALKTPKVIDLPVIKDRVLLEDVLQKMRDRKYPMTHEGVVVIPLGGRPLKAKLKSDADVIIRDIFPAETKNGVLRAGGFTYSLPGSLEITGRVGSGILHALLKDMLANPENYKGKLARIEAQDQYPSGAYRAPRFKALRALGD